MCPYPPNEALIGRFDVYERREALALSRCAASLLSCPCSARFASIIASHDRSAPLRPRKLEKEAAQEHRHLTERRDRRRLRRDPATGDCVYLRVTAAFHRPVHRARKKHTSTNTSNMSQGFEAWLLALPVRACAGQAADQAEGTEHDRPETRNPASVPLPRSLLLIFRLYTPTKKATEHRLENVMTSSAHRIGDHVFDSQDEEVNPENWKDWGHLVRPFTAAQASDWSDKAGTPSPQDLERFVSEGSYDNAGPLVFDSSDEEFNPQNWKDWDHLVRLATAACICDWIIELMRPFSPFHRIKGEL